MYIYSDDLCRGHLVGDNGRAERIPRVLLHSGRDLSREQAAPEQFRLDVQLEDRQRPAVVVHQEEPERTLQNTALRRPLRTIPPLVHTLLHALFLPHA